MNMINWIKSFFKTKEVKNIQVGMLVTNGYVTGMAYSVYKTLGLVSIENITYNNPNLNHRYRPPNILTLDIENVEEIK